MSYQHDTTKGEYEPIKTGEDAPSNNGTTKKWVITGIVLAVLALFVVRQPAGATTEMVMKNSNIPLNEDGSVKLFDKLSKWCKEYF